MWPARVGNIGGSEILPERSAPLQRPSRPKSPPAPRPAPKHPAWRSEPGSRAKDAPRKITRLGTATLPGPGAMRRHRRCGGLDSGVRLRRTASAALLAADPVPVLVASRAFRPIARVFVAFGPSASTQRDIERRTESPMPRGLSVTMVHAGKASRSQTMQMGEARARREQSGLEVATESAAAFASARRDLGPPRPDLPWAGDEATGLLRVTLHLPFAAAHLPSWIEPRGEMAAAVPGGQFWIVRQHSALRDPLPGPLACSDWTSNTSFPPSRAAED
jgi:hypothetical protein